ncbi:MAG: phenylalanine--tRNA ligase subunit beta [Planctomycetota bacterium]
MKISYRWLGRHVDLTGITPQRVVEDLTLSTAEVEGLERFLPHLSDVVVGHVVKRDKHPDADKLSYCMVDVGQSELLGIVCGAPNVAAGQRVAVALAGTELPNDIKIKKSKIRGVESNGMICSERELGLGEEHGGIWVLPESARIGKPVAEELGLVDWVIEIDNKSLTHRPDLWGHRGIAREIAAMHLRPLKPLDTSIAKAGGGQPFPVRIESTGCTRYVAVAIDGVAARRSPDWLRTLLLAVGQRPIDLLVDVSNFVMLDIAQPNHLFDRDRLKAGIVVRNARAGEALRTLDGVERKLTGDDMLICAGEEPVALAGVMGGEGSKVSAQTRSLLLEVATFQPAQVRRTAQRLALRTDASARFEKSLDPTLPMLAAGHLVNVLREIEPGAHVAAPVTDAGTWTDPAKTVRLRGDRARAVLGTDVSDIEIEGILMRLGFHVQRSGDELFVDVPSARATKDITGEHDLIEEIGRIHRYGNIPERKLVAEIVPPPRDERRVLVRTLQDRLAGAARFRETLSYSFVPDTLVAQTGEASDRFVAVINPVAEGLTKVRRRVVTSLLGALASNRRQREEVRLFEIGKGYLPETPSARGEPREVHELALVWASLPETKGARFDASRLSQLQGVIEDLVLACGLEHVTWTRAESGSVPSWAHPGRCLSGTIGGAIAVTLAAIEPGVARALGLAGELASDVAAAEIAIDRLLSAPKRAAGYRPIPKFPIVKVDVACAVGAECGVGEVAAVIEKSGKGLVDSTELFDVYAGPNMGAGRKSLAFHVSLMSDARTLTDQDVKKFLERVEREVAAIGGELRRE